MLLAQFFGSFLGPCRDIFLGLEGTRFRSCQVIITPKAGKGSGMVAKARELAEKHGWFLGWSIE